MGFFNLIESAFFASLAITFVLVIMLVYHFKERLVSLEKKYDTMFQILNRVVKELKNLHENDSIEDMSRACLSESSIGFELHSRALSLGMSCLTTRLLESW